jgi:hypothetical protein
MFKDFLMRTSGDNENISKQRFFSWRESLWKKIYDGTSGTLKFRSETFRKVLTVTRLRGAGGGRSFKNILDKYGYRERQNPRIWRVVGLLFSTLQVKK